MKKLGNFLMIGAAATAAVAIIAGPVLARDINFHNLTLRMPDGGMEQVRYIGNTPPQVSFDDFSLRPDTVADIFFANPFAAMEQISADMDRQAAQLMNLASNDAFPAGPQSMKAMDARLNTLPPGTEGYSVYTVSSGGKTCTEKMAFGYDGQGKPMIEKASSGSCGVGAAAQQQAPTYHVSAPAPSPAPLRPDGVKTIEAAM
ncbi:hypothetical protein [Rhizobium sp. C1]|uniref:hypothetical protein n=1 Tax=Rhizobium sp. C1 TaxID=1349799 RepID=UPI001E46EFA5|nr:hypothetical protein [Rhizobium sp. C1]MCD2177705.1 hypothetical protein [Rhizobium sp. C1]